MSEAIRILHRRIENELWSVILPILENSKIARWIISAIDQFLLMVRTPEFWVKSLLGASLGLWLGIVIGMIIGVIY